MSPSSAHSGTQVTLFDAVRHIAAGANVCRRRQKGQRIMTITPVLSGQLHVPHFFLPDFSLTGHGRNVMFICGSVEADSPVLNSTGSSVSGYCSPLRPVQATLSPAALQLFRFDISLMPGRISKRIIQNSMLSFIALMRALQLSRRAASVHALHTD